MLTVLQATQALDKARAAFAKVEKRDRASTTRKAAAAAVTAAYADLVGALTNAGMHAQAAQMVEAKVIHHMKHEEKTVQVDSKKPPQSEEGSAPPTTPSGEQSSGAQSSSADSEEERRQEKMRKEEEEKKANMRKEEERKAAKKKGAGYEEEEEKALVASYADGTRRYARATREASAKLGRDLDAMGHLYGPSALLALAQKAFDTKGVRDTFGALRARAEGTDGAREMAARVEQLEAKTRGDEIEQLVQKAKAEGRATSHAKREYLRGFGAKHGAAELRGMIAQLPKMRTTEDGHREPGEKGAHGGAPVGAATEEQLAYMVQQLGYTEGSKEATEFRAEFRRREAADAATAGKVPVI